MTGPTIKAKAKRVREYELKGRMLHTFRDRGSAIAEKDWRPRQLWSGITAEERLAEAFRAAGQDYGGPIA